MTPLYTDDEPAAATSPEWFKVRLTHPSHNRRVAFRSVSEDRARTFLQNRFPRGSEAYLEHPDGTTEHYERERQGVNGTSASQWAPFNPDDWIPVDQQPPPGESAWADKEG